MLCSDLIENVHSWNSSLKKTYFASKSVTVSLPSYSTVRVEVAWIGKTVVLVFGGVPSAKCLPRRALPRLTLWTTKVYVAAG